MNSHHSDNTVAFLEKIKKQAKKLLKLSKNNGLKIEIKSLSEAQNLLAEVNGYPDWHALVSNFNNLINKSNSPNCIPEDILVSNPGEKLFLTEENGIYSLHENNQITSFFELTTFPLEDSYSAKEWMTKFKNDLALKWNMQFHKINILFNFCNKDIIKSEQHIFFKWSNILGITKEQFDEFFAIDLAPPSTGFGLQVICAVSTIDGLMDEHISFCNEFSNDFINKVYIHKEQYDCLLNNSLNPQTYLGQSEDKNNLRPLIVNYTKDPSAENLNWLYGLQFLYQKKIPIKLVATITNDTQNLMIILESQTSDNYTTFLKGLWASLNQTIYSSFKINESINLLPISETKISDSNNGIPFINKTDGNITHIDVHRLQQFHQTNFIYAKPGSGKSMLLNSIDIDRVLSQSKNGSMPYVCSIDIGPSKKGVIHFLQNTLEKEYKEKVIYHKLTNNDIINPFDTELGCRYPSALQHDFLLNFILLILSKHNIRNDFLSKYISELISITYRSLSDEEAPVKYDVGFNTEIDQLIDNIKYPITLNTTWWNIVDVLFQNNYIKQAKIAQRHANPMLGHILHINRSEALTSVYGGVTVETGESIPTYVGRCISEVLKDFPNFSKLTSLDFKDAKVISLDLDNFCTAGGMNAQHKAVIYYALASFALAKHCKMYLKSLGSEPEKINPIYIQYFKNEYQQYLYDLASISFDEYHRVSTFKSMNEIIYSYFKESRKHYFGFTLASQSQDDYFKFYEYCNNTFIYALDLNHPSPMYSIVTENIKDHRVLSHFNNKNKMKHMDILFSSKTNNGNIEKIISLKLNPFILWSINSNYEDSFIKESLTKKLGYITAMKLLVNKYPYGVKKTIEEILEKNKTLNRDLVLENFIETILK